QAPRPFGITFPGRRKKEAAPTLRTVILASVTAGAITTMGVGAYLLGGSGHDGKPAVEVAAMEPPPTAAPLETPAAPGAAASVPNLAVAVSPPLAVAAPAKAPAAKHLVTPDAPASVSAASPAPMPLRATGKGLFASAVSRLDNGDLTGLPDLQKAADQGSPAAQFYLARLYEAGGAGLKKDLGAARQWTARAAQNGDSAAMYNLASYMYAGDGGAKDVPGAATWFRKAAEHGVVNGQYNIAQLYEKGYGVPQNNAEAYKWYLVAAGSGDTEARSAADSLKARIAADVQASAERSAAQLRTQLPGGVKTAAAQP
ncbi:tetratricopeptide repeat protein, partial [Caulobacter sp. S45]|uniref:tetratricopeptide repeat protein n=1 Tax=Caulobacter sp. S45 TaxID=1641861 RepID=UPI00157608F4